MHDKNGREIRKEDVVRVKEYDGKLKVITVNELWPGNTSCNLQGVRPIFGGVQYMTVTAKDCELVATNDGQLPETRAVSAALPEVK